MKNIELFDKYLKKQMNVEEKLSFENDLAVNAQLSEAFAKYKLAIELLKFNNLKKEINSVHQDFTKPQTKVFRFPIMRIAAVLILGFLTFGSFWAMNTNGNELLDNQTLSYIEPLNRGDVEEKKQAELLYANGDFEQLILLYKSTSEPNKKLNFLTSMAYFKQKKYQDALLLIEQMETKNTTAEFKNELQFYKGQCLVGLNKIDEALKVFENLDKKNPYKNALSWQYLLKLRILSIKT